MNATKTTFSQRLIIALRDRGMSQSDLARAVGVRSPTVNMWCSGKTKAPSGELCMKVAQALGVSGDWLFSGEGTQEKAATGDYVAIPYVHVKFAAGNGLEPTLEEQADQSRALISRRWFETHGTSAANCKMFDVTGDSMEPMIFDGDQIIVDMSDVEIRPGKIYAFIFGGDLRVKKLIPLMSGGFLVKSTNSQYVDETISKDDLSVAYFRIVGRVIGRIGSGGF